LAADDDRRLARHGPLRNDRQPLVVVTLAELAGLDEGFDAVLRRLQRPAAHRLVGEDPVEGHNLVVAGEDLELRPEREHAVEQLPRGVLLKAHHAAVLGVVENAVDLVAEFGGGRFLGGLRRDARWFDGDGGFVRGRLSAAQEQAGDGEVREEQARAPRLPSWRRMPVWHAGRHRHS
jgi:hypothetical protein